MFLKELELEIGNFVETNDTNLVKDIDGMQIFDKPLIGLAASDDPLWNTLKKPEVVGPNHMTPTEWMSESKSVLSYFLPFSETVRKSNITKGMPSKEWLYGRWEGELFNNALRSFVVKFLEDQGCSALAPALNEGFSVENHKSNWSERHVAYIAGLGTFSINRSLITNKGTAGRFGSVIMDWELEPKLRNYTEVNEYCDGCGSCISRCPCNAITLETMDKDKCSSFLKKF
ncbi:MAG: 4Fe-4S binding protein [Methanobacterium sp. ERen5]|nr:MAG: 4Fe-4S binding protein [Methanobacterium sp. ERen5]